MEKHRNLEAWQYGIGTSSQSDPEMAIENMIEKRVTVNT